MNIKDFYTAFKKPVTFLLAILLLGGGYFYSKLQVSLFPEVTFPKVKVIADAGLQPADRMMVTVTRPMENAIKQVPGLKMIRSTTSRGSCEISAFLDWKSDVSMSQLQIQSRVNQIRDQLPANISITVEKMTPSILPVIGYSLESKTRSLIDLKYMATYQVKPFLSQVEGVASVAILGGKEKEYRFIPDRQKMSSLGITLATLKSRFEATGFIRSNGFLPDYRRLYLSVTDASMHDKSDVENMVVKNDGNRIILLKDLGQVKIEKATEYIKVNANGKEGVLVNIVKQPGANLVSTTDAVQKKLAQLRKSLPKDVTIKPYYVQANFVNGSIRSVMDAFWIGLVLAIVVALIFLRSAKAGSTILITIPITLGTTLIVLYTLGYTFNIMTLGALVAAMGLIIDDAVVVIEQIHRTHEEHPDVHSRELVGKSIRYLFPAMVGSSLSTIVIFLPFGLMSGVAGAYFHIMTNTMMITLICSFLVTWLGLPVVYLLLSGKPKKKADKPEAHVLKQQTWVNFFTHRSYINVLIVVLLLGAIAWVYPRLETGFLPEMDEGSIVLDYNSPPGASLQATNKMLQEVNKIILATPEVKAYSVRTGAQMGFFITEPNRGDYLIELKDHRKKTTEEVINEIRQKVDAKVPGLTTDYGQVIGDMLGDLTTSVQPIVIKIFGNDDQKLQSLSRKTASLVEQVKGTADVFDGIVIAGPSISVVPDYAAMARYGITADNLQYQMKAAVEGNVVGDIFNGNYLSNIRIIDHDSTNVDLDRLQNLKVFMPGGQLIPLSRVAKIKFQSGESEIERENLQNMYGVTARLAGRDLGSVMSDIKATIQSNLVIPQGYHIEYGGAYIQQQQSFKELLTILIIASMLVFGVILFMFREMKAPLIILLISVLGLSGGFMALYLTHTPLNVGSYTGLIMIVGIIGENAIFTYMQFKRAFKETGKVHESITHAISVRLRPNLMTALCAITALAPLALGIGTGAQLHQPLAIAVVGGFIVALPLLLIVLPGLLSLTHKNK